MSKDILKRLTQECRVKLAALTKRSDTLSKQEILLREDWEALAKMITKLLLEDKQSVQKAQINLDDAVQKAVIEIQFTTDVGQVKEILASLPSVDQLLNPGLS